MIDAHAHLDKYGDALPKALGQIRDLSILTVAVSMDVDSYEVTRSIADGEPLILPSFGIHPWEAGRYRERLRSLDSFLDSAPLIGEIGLDRYFVRDSERYPSQDAVFAHCLDSAEGQGKVVNIHTTGAEAAVLEHLKPRSLKGVIIHWYSGPLELVKDFLDLGAFFTIGVEVLCSPHIQELAGAIPVDRLLTETDNPGGWEWMEGEAVFPELLSRVESVVASIRGLERGHLTRQVEENMSRLLSLGGIPVPVREGLHPAADQ